MTTSAVNVEGTLNVLLAARDEEALAVLPALSHQPEEAEGQHTRHQCEQHRLRRRHRRALATGKNRRRDGASDLPDGRRQRVDLAEGLEILVIGAPNLGEAPREDVEGQRDWWAD